MSLDEAQRDVARTERDRLRAAGPAWDPKFRGCFVAFIGMIVLTLTPALGACLDIPPGLALGILVGAVLLLAGGAVIGLVGGSRQEDRAARDRDEALATLRDWAEGAVPEEEGIRAAVRFLHAGGGRLIDGASDVPPEARALIGRVARSDVED